MEHQPSGLGTAWRLLIDGACDGPWNMAADEAISAAVGAGLQPPTLRLYAWAPACLSLGYGTRAAAVDFARLDALGWGCIRRPTGGQAVLHTDELTYSLALPTDQPLAAGSVLESCARLSAALLAALDHMGAGAQAAQHDPISLKGAGPVCFEAASAYEIVVGGRKLLGSAQRRATGALMQHGTLPLAGDITRICDVLAYPDDSARQAAKAALAARALTLEAALGRAITWGEAADALQWGFRAAFNVRFALGALSTAERAAAEALRHEKYAAAEWTQRR